MIRTLATLSILALSTTFASSQESPFTCEPPRLIGSVSGYIDPSIVTIDGNFVYIITEGQGYLTIIDISDITNPTLVSTTELYENFVSQISINGDAAYISHDYTMSIYNIEDKADPWFRRFFPTNGSNGAIPRSDSHIFHPYDFAINIERPFAPGIDRYDNDLPFIDEPAYVIGNELYTSDLSRYDISNPTSPVLLFENHFSSSLRPYTTRFESPYFISSEFGDLSYGALVPTEPAIALRGYDNLPIYDATVRSGLIFAATQIDTLDVYAPNAAGLETIATFGIDDGIVSPRLIRQLGDYFLIAGNDTLGIYEIPTNPMTSTETIDESTYIEIINGTAVLGNERFTSTTDSMSLIDLSNPVSQPLLGKLPSLDSSRDNQGMASSGSTLFVADGYNGLYHYDLTDPSSPTILANYNTSTDPKLTPRTRDIDIHNNLAVAADSSHGLFTYTINPDLSLTQIGHLDIDDLLQRVTILDDLAFVCSHHTAYIVDLSNPATPNVLATLEGEGDDTPYFVTAQRNGDFLYTAEYDTGYRIFDITDPADPIELAHFDADITTKDGTYLAFVYDLLIEDNTLYIAMSSGGFAIYDNTNIFAPVLISHIPTGQPQNSSQLRFREFIKDNDTLYIASGAGGLRTYSLDGCSLPCAIDLNDDGQLNFFDVNAYIELYTAMNPAADMNNDGQFNFFDVTAFVVAFQNGCP
jgi:hypothetical protein